MSHQYHIDTEKRFITHWYRGEIRYHDLVDSIAETIEDSRYDSTCDGILDCRDVRLHLSPGELRQLIAYLNTLAERTEGLRAILVDTPTAAALAMLFKQAGGRPTKTQVFTTVEAALGWLGRAMDEAQLLDMP